MSTRRDVRTLAVAGALALFALGGCGSGGSGSTATVAAPRARADRIVFERSGGVAAPRVPDRIVVTDRADLDRLAALIPSTVPKAPSGGPTGCADCRSYRLTIVSGASTRTASFDEISVPPAYRRLVAALSARL